jgi:hypothetical protein
MMPMKWRVATLGCPGSETASTFLRIGNSDEFGVAKIRQTARKKTKEVQRLAFGAKAR